MEALKAKAQAIKENLLPQKSKDKYIHTYNLFMEWHRAQELTENDFSEDVMLVYFAHLQEKYASTSVWCFYSMLRTALQRNHNVDINYPPLHTQLKQGSVGYQPKRAKNFSPEAIRRFLVEADDVQYLVVKVIMLLGVYGATRGQELTNMVMNDVREEGSVFIIRIPETKTKIVRTFTIEGEHAEYLRRYKSIRSEITVSDRFLMNYQKGKCTKLPIGRNKILNAPKIIAKYLELDDPDAYSGHSFRRTSATCAADGGADLLTLKRHGGWRSSSVVEGYLEDSINNKRKIGSLIAGQINSSMNDQFPSTELASNLINGYKSTTPSSDMENLFTDISTTLVSTQVVITRTITQENEENDGQEIVAKRFRMDDLQRMQFNNCKVEINFHK